MGAEFRDKQLANSAAGRAQALEGIRRRREAIQQRGAAPQSAPESQAGTASMFPEDSPSPPSAPLGFEESSFRRGEVTRERDRTGRREEIFNNFRGGGSFGSERINPGGAVERGAGMFGAPFGGAGSSPIRPGIAFGPGRTTRVPQEGSPEYVDMMRRMRSMRR